VPEGALARWAPPARGAEGARFALWAAHLLTIWSIAISNVVLGVALLAELARGRQAFAAPPRTRTATRLMLAYLVLLVAAVAASEDVRWSARALTDFFNFGTFFLALALVRGERAARWTVDTLILVATGVAASGLFQLLFGYGELDKRIRGPFSHYMIFAGILLVVDVLLVARLLARRRPETPAGGPTGLLDRGWVSWFCLAVLTTAIVGSLTRNAMVGLVAATLLVVALTRPRLLAVAPAVVIAAIVVAPVPVVARAMSIDDLSDPAVYDRLCMAEAGLRMIGERPLLGLGPNEVKRLYPLYRHPTAPRLLIPHLHDAFLELAAERGVPELAVYLALVAAASLAAWRGFRRGASDADLHLGAMGALAGFLVAGLFEDNWGSTSVQRVVLLLLALPFCLAPESPALLPASGDRQLGQPARPLGEREEREEGPAVVGSPRTMALEQREGARGIDARQLERP